MSLICSKCGKKLNMLSNQATEDSPICFDCYEMNEIEKDQSLASEDGKDISVGVGFGSRFIANTLDMFVLFPVAGVTFIMLNLGKYQAVLFLVSTYLLASLYPITCIAIWGRTFGKHVLGIEVKTINGDNCSWKEGFLRSVIPFIDQIIIVSFFTLILINAPDSFYSAEYNEKLAAYNSATVSISRLNSFIMSIWLLIGFVVFLSNNKRRALHDYIAGTVVVKRIK